VIFLEIVKEISSGTQITFRLHSIKDAYRAHDVSLTITNIFHNICITQDPSQTMNTAGSAAYIVAIYIYIYVHRFICLYNSLLCKHCVYYMK